MRTLQIVVVLSALIAGAALSSLSMRTSIASSSLDVVAVREDARLNFGDRCILHYVNETDILDHPSVTPRELSRECVCLYRSVESSYQDRPEVTPRLENALETLFLISAFEDSLNQKYLQNYRMVIGSLSAQEKETYHSLVDGYGKEVQAHATKCILSGT